MRGNTILGDAAANVIIGIGGENEDNLFQAPFDKLSFRCLRDEKGFQAMRLQQRRLVRRERSRAAAVLRRMGKSGEAAALEKLA